MIRLTLACGRPAQDVVRILHRIGSVPGRSAGDTVRTWLAGGGQTLTGTALPADEAATFPAVIAAVGPAASLAAPLLPRVWLAWDGLLTNRRDLALELGLRSECDDTAVVAAAYRRWGEQCLSRLDGQWALLVGDADERIVLAARDPLGVGQLYYGEQGDIVVIASEPSIVASARRGGPEIEPARFGQFLNGFPPSTPHLTFFHGVRAVAAGGAVRIRLDASHRPTVDVVKFWDPRSLADRPHVGSRFPEVADRFESLLVRAVRTRGESGRVGALVSGGMDSSTIAAIAADVAGSHRLASFSILHDREDLTEEPHIRSVVSHVGLDAHYRSIAPQNAWDAVDDVVRIQGEPLLGQDLIGQWLAYGFAAEHGIDTLYDGIGADELLAGPGTEGRYLLDLARRVRLVALTRELRSMATRHRLPVTRVVRHTMLGAIRRDAAWALGRRRYRWIARPIPRDPMRHELRTDVIPDASLLNRYLYRHVRHQNAPTILARLDRTAAAVGIRPLLPFLDRELVEWCMALPDRFKVHRGQPKRVLHGVACRRLPASVAGRTDNMAIVSSSAWMPLRTEYADVIRAVPAERAMRESGWIDVPAAQRFVDAYLSGSHDDHLAVWRLFTAWRWLEVFRLA